MARKDTILKSFLEHELLVEKYGLSQVEIPQTVQEGLKSDKPIIKAIALIIENSESNTPITDKTLYTMITQLLNTTAI